MADDPDEPPPWPWEEFTPRYEVAYDAAQDAAHDQRELIDGVRNRAVTLLSVAAGILAFLGDRLFTTGAVSRLNTGWWIFNSRLTLAVAIASFLVVVSSAVFAWWPIAGAFTLGGDEIISTHIEGPQRVESHAELLRELALSTMSNVEDNRLTIQPRLRALTWAMAALGLQLVMMLLTLWDIVE